MSKRYLYNRGDILIRAICLEVILLKAPISHHLIAVNLSLINRAVRVSLNIIWIFMEIKIKMEKIRAMKYRAWFLVDLGVMVVYSSSCSSSSSSSHSRIWWLKVAHLVREEIEKLLHKHTNGQAKIPTSWTFLTITRS